MLNNLVLIIGGNGFIGKNLAKALKKSEFKVIVFDASPKDPDYDVDEFYLGNTHNHFSKLSELIHRVDVVYHLGWNSTPQTANDSPLKDLEDNVSNNLKLLVEIAKYKTTKKFIFLSSGGTIYGDNDSHLIKESQHKNPINAYGISKLTFELYIQLFERISGLNYLILRPSNIYGPGARISQSQGAIPLFINQLIHRKPINVWGDGENVRDYLYIDDLISALISLIDYNPKNNQPKVFNVGSGVGTSTNELIKTIFRVTGAQTKVTHTQKSLVDVKSIILDTNLIHQVLGWKPCTHLNEGIAMTYNYLTNLVTSNDDR